MTEITPGQQVAQARRDAGLTQAELGDLIGERLHTIELIEHDNVDSARYLDSISAATGRSLTYAGTANEREVPRADSASVRRGGASETLGPALVLAVLAIVVGIRFFTEKLPLLPRAFNFVDVPLLVLLVTAAIAGRRVVGPGARRYGGLVGTFVALCVISTLVNLGRVALGPVLIFLYGFAGPIAFYWATYRLWSPGRSLLASRFLVGAGLVQLLVVAAIDLPRFAASNDPDDISGTFGENAYQLVFFMIVFAALVAGIATFETRRLTARAAPLLVALSFGVIFLAQYRTLLVTTAVSVAIAGILLSSGRGRGLAVAGMVGATFVFALGYVAARFPITKFESTISALQDNPSLFVSARIDAFKDVGSVYSESPHVVVTGTGPGTFSSRAWKTFAYTDSRSTSDVAGPYVRALTGGRPYRTDVADRYTVPRLQEAEVILGSRALTQPHSSYTALLVETGIVGFALMIAVYAKAILHAGRIAGQTMREARGPDALAPVMLACVIAFSVLIQMAVFENWLEVARTTVPTWMLLAIVTREYDVRKAHEQT